MTDLTQLRQENRAVVEAFFASNLDRPEERIALWHPDGVKELPFQQEYFNSEILADAERAARAKGRSPIGGPTS